jgi:ABC-2 type transport system permease protein
VIASIVPAKYLVHALRGILLKGNGLDVVWKDLLGMALFAAAVLAIATIRFKRRIA